MATLTSYVKSIKDRSVSTITSNVLLDGTLTESIILTATETSDTTTADYLANNIIKNSDSGLIYICTADSASGALLTDTAYFSIDTTNTLIITDGVFSFTSSRDDKGYIRDTQQITETIDFAGVTDGLKWIGKKIDNTGWVFRDIKPVYDFITLKWESETDIISFLKNPILVASETPMDIRFDDKLLTNTMESIEVAGDVKTQGEFVGKNACTALVNFDGADGTIQGSFNVNSVIRNSTGDYTILFENTMNNASYCISGMSKDGDDSENSTTHLGITGPGAPNEKYDTEGFNVTNSFSTTLYDTKIATIIVFGGK